MKPSAYLDAVKAQLNLTSDYQLAKALEIPRQSVPGIRSGERAFALDTLYRIAITLQLDPAEVIADLAEQREKNPERREFWRSFLSRAAYGVAATVGTLALILSVTLGNGAKPLGGFFVSLKRA